MSGPKSWIMWRLCRALELSTIVLRGYGKSRKWPQLCVWRADCLICTLPVFHGDRFQRLEVRRLFHHHVSITGLRLQAEIASLHRWRQVPHTSLTILWKVAFEKSLVSERSCHGKDGHSVKGRTRLRDPKLVTNEPALIEDASWQSFNHGQRAFNTHPHYSLRIHTRRYACPLFWCRAPYP